MTPSELFWSHVDRSGECWLWAAALFPSGYGCTTWIGRSERAHRVAWALEFNNGELPNSWVLHKCDNPGCVRPSHLFLGSHADNEADKTAKGRRPTGELHGCHKLTSEDVRWLRWARAYAGVSFPKLARPFGVTHQAVQAAVKRRTWKEQQVKHS